MGLLECIYNARILTEMIQNWFWFLFTQKFATYHFQSVQNFGLKQTESYLNLFKIIENLNSSKVLWFLFS